MTKTPKQLLLEEIALRLKASVDFATFGEYIHRHDLQPLKHSRVHKYVCEKLQEVLSGDIKKIIINLPPNTGKTSLASVLLPAFILGHDHTKKIYCTSHTTSFSIKNSQKIKHIMNSSLYKNIFPNTKIGRQGTDFKISDSSDFWQVYNNEDPTHAMGSVTAKGILSGSQGERVDILIVDDLYANRADANSRSNRQKVWDEFQTGLMSRLNPDGIVIILNTRFHVDDLSGMIIKNQKSRKEDIWEIISLPAVALENDILGRVPGEALWPERWPIKKLTAIQNSDMPESDWEALYQQSPVIRGGAILRRDDWQIWSEIDYPKFDYAIMSIDCALKANQFKDNDYHACTIGILFRPPAQEFEWPDVVAMIRKYGDTHQQLLDDLRSYYIDELEFQELMLSISIETIRDIRLGTTRFNNIPDQMIKQIRANDDHLSKQFGKRIPISLLISIIENPLTDNIMDSFSRSSDYQKGFFQKNRWNVDQFVGDTYSWKEDRPYNLLIVRAWQERCGYVELKQRVIQEYNTWQKHYKMPFDQVLIEDTAAGPSLIADLDHAGIEVLPWQVSGKDKSFRAHMATPMLRQGRVWGLGQKKKLENPRTGEIIYTRSDTVFDQGIETLIHECEIFPNGTHDDLVDACTQMINYVRTMMPIKLNEDEFDLEDPDDPQYQTGTQYKIVLDRPYRD